MLRCHEPLLLNWFRAREKFSAGCVESRHGKAKLQLKTACGFKSCHVAEVAVLHILGKLPTPQVTHRFCCRGGFQFSVVSGFGSGWCRGVGCVFGVGVQICLGIDL